MKNTVEKYMHFVLLFCIGSYCTGKPGDSELLEAAQAGTQLLEKFSAEYEKVATAPDCTRVLQQYADAWSAQVVPLQQKGLQKKERKSELEIHQRFGEDYPEVANKFRTAFRLAHDTGKRRAEFCKADPAYSKTQERAWRIFLGLRVKN